MKLYKLLWETHKWIGIVLSVVFFNMAASGLYLWLQPIIRKNTESKTVTSAHDIIEI